MNKKLFTIFVFLLGAAIGFSFSLINFKNISNSLFYADIENDEAIEENPTTTTEEIKIFAVGDIMLDRGIEKIQERFFKTWKYPFLKIKGFLDKSDILFGNLEGPISDKGTKQGSIYSFRFKPGSVKALNYAGFDILSLANNHMLDYGKEALEETLRILEESGIKHSGAGKKNEAFSLKTMEIKDTKIGFLSYTNLGPSGWRASSYAPGLAWINRAGIQNVTNYIKAIKRKGEIDVLAVSLHAGEEYNKKPTTFQKEFSRFCVDAGADIIIGHHPHVTAPVKKYKDGWIAYSLGNFVFDQGFSNETQQGLLLEIIIENKKIKEVKKHDIKMGSFFQPELKK